MKSQASGAQVRTSATRIALWTAVVLILFGLPKTVHAQLTSFNDTMGEHAIFLGNDAHVHQLLCVSNCDASASWANQDLTNMAGGTAAGAFSTVTSYGDPIGEHIFFVDGAQHVNHIFSSNGTSWSNTNLGVQSAGGISGYSALGQVNYSTTNEERLFFETTDQHVHMLVSSNGGAFDNVDLTSSTGGTLAAYGTGFASFNDSSGEHVFYEGANWHIYQLYGAWVARRGFICNPITRICTPYTYGVINWTNQDLTAMTNALLGGGSLTGYSDSTGQYVFYTAQDSHLHKMLYSGSGWTDQDMSNATGLLPYGISPASFGNTRGEQFFTVGTDLDVHELFESTSTHSTVWSNQNVSVAVAPIASPCFGGQLAGFSRPSPYQVESDVFYAANDGSIHRLSQTSTEFISMNGVFGWMTSGWVNTNLIPSSTEVGPMFRCFN